MCALVARGASPAARHASIMPRPTTNRFVAPVAKYQKVQPGDRRAQPRSVHGAPRSVTRTEPLPPEGARGAASLEAASHSRSTKPPRSKERRVIARTSRCWSPGQPLSTPQKM